MPDASCPPACPKRRVAWYLVTVVAVVALDFLSKRWVEGVLVPGEVIPVAPFFNLVLTYNKGAAFSLLAEASGWQRPFFIAITLGATVLILYLLRRHWRDTLFGLALSLILGGAIGNLWDRVVLGHVVDFLDFHAAGWHWPAFNVADSAITVGAVLVVLDSLRKPRDTGTRPRP